MKNTEWVNGIFGSTRIYNNKYEFKDYFSCQILSFDTEEERNEYLQELFIHTCDLSANS